MAPVSRPPATGAARIWNREDVAGVLRRLAEEAEQVHHAGPGAPAVETLAGVFVPPARLRYLAELAEAGEL